MSDASAALKVLSELSALGVRLSLDDFGTGAASYSYLKSLPVLSIVMRQSDLFGSSGLYQNSQQNGPAWERAATA